MANNTYVMVMARAVDILFATVLWRDYDVTISTLCALELRKQRHGETHKAWMCDLGRALNWLQTNHCELALAADRQRATQAQALMLSVPP